jgi:cytochrome c peroxidase
MSGGGRMDYRVSPVRLIAGWLCTLAITSVAGLGHSAECRQSPVDPVSLGEQLFNSKALSSKGDMSCSSCHIPDKGFMDGYERALSRTRQLTRRTPTLLNLRYYSSFSWDGRNNSLNAQIEGALLARHEMNSSEERLRQAMARIYCFSGSSSEAKALAVDSLSAYLRSVQNHQTRYTEFAAGKAALSADEMAGYKTLIRLGCLTCHSEPNFTDNRFHDIGLPKRRLVLQSTSNPPQEFELGFDYGRGNIEPGKASLFSFRTPSLFNVTLNAAFMHDGTFRSLDEVLSFYESRGLYDGSVRVTLTGEERENIKSFLKTLETNGRSSSE